MGTCTAPYCSNSPRNKVKMYRFPREKTRRDKWILNCRRDNWRPTAHSELCEIHFEKSQFELHRKDGFVKLKPNAVPTLFPVPKPSARHNTKRIAADKNAVKKTRKISSSTITSVNQPDACVNITNNSSNAVKKTSKISSSTITSLNHPDACVNETGNSINDEIARLQMENTSLKNLIEEKDTTLRSLLNDDQVAATKKTTQNLSTFNGVKLRCALGIDGYNYLRNLNYPIPAYNTLTKFLKKKIKSGVFDDLVELIKNKVQESMDSNEH